MATVVLGALGTLVGGPLGGAIGALAGRQLDGAIIGKSTRDGPRLKDLAVTTSSYGQPIARLFGRVRVAGSVIWATDLVERRESNGGSKGRPGTTSYSYTMSFAVALSSSPIRSIGRIWADGSLLRGALGDLKVGGTMRIYSGHGDQSADPLIASAMGGQCPAFRNCAYVVFEDLQLADYGNRIPVLTFEVIADQREVELADIVAPLGSAATTAAPLAGLLGYEHAGGDLRSVLAAVDELYPLACLAADAGVKLDPLAPQTEPLPILPPAVVDGNGSGEDGLDHGRALSRIAGGRAIPAAIRYYDVDRDYQPGVQRVEGLPPGEGAGRTTEFAGALAASTARSLVQGAVRKARARSDRLVWRMSSLDPSVGPGSHVRAPGHEGRWMVVATEWQGDAVELELERYRGEVIPVPSAHPGATMPPADHPATPTWLRAFELPWDGNGSAAERRLYAAVSSSGPGWAGAALYIERDGILQPAGASGRSRATVGTLRTPLPPSPALRLEMGAALEVDLLASDMAFHSVTPEQMSGGANRLLIGDEIVQFAAAEPLGEARWRLSGLLRGRGATERAAAHGHLAGIAAVLIGDGLIALSGGDVPGESMRVAAIGLADEEPIFSLVRNQGSSLRPPAPVHGTAKHMANGNLVLGWVRRARGNWQWPDGIETPLVEELERYRVGAGPVDSPLATWETDRPALTLQSVDVADLPTGTVLWVRQLGHHAPSEPALLRAVP